jgi:PTS system glucose-specific EIICBA component
MMVLFTNMDKVDSISIATEGSVQGKEEVGKVTLKA